MDETTTVIFGWIMLFTLFGMVVFVVYLLAGGKSSTSSTQAPIQSPREDSASSSGSTPVYAYDERLSHINMDVLNRRLYWDREGQNPYGRKLSIPELQKRADEATRQKEYDDLYGQ